MAIKCLCVDFGNVIAFFDHQQACNELAKLSKERFTGNELYNDLFQESGLEQKYDNGSITTNQFIKMIKKKYKLKGRSKKIKNIWCDIFSKNNLMIELLQRLTNHRYDLILASNTNELQYKWFKKKFKNELNIFKEEVISFQIKHCKPERAFFEECIQKSGFKACECIFIDDRSEFVNAATDAGMKGIKYTSIEVLLKDLEKLGVIDKTFLNSFNTPVIQPRKKITDADKEIYLT